MVLSLSWFGGSQWDQVLAFYSLLFFFFLVKDIVSLYSLPWSATHCLDKLDSDLQVLTHFTFWVLRVKAYITMPAPRVPWWREKTRKLVSPHVHREASAVGHVWYWHMLSEMLCSQWLALSVSWGRHWGGILKCVHSCWFILPEDKSKPVGLWFFFFSIHRLEGFSTRKCTFKIKALNLPLMQQLGHSRV